MRTRKLIWHIFPAILTVTIISLVTVIWYISSSLTTFYNGWMAKDLEDRAYLVRDQVADLVSRHRIGQLNLFCRRTGRKTSTRITVIDPRGVVLADSDKDRSLMNNHAGRPEIQRAMAGETGVRKRLSATLGKQMLYVAVPLFPSRRASKGEGRYVLRMSMPIRAINNSLAALRWEMVLAGGVTIVLAMLASILIARRISRPLEEMTVIAQRISREEFPASLAIDGGFSKETKTLADAIGTMAAELRERFRTILRQRNELQTILASMTESILVIDRDLCLIDCNKAALALFGVPETRMVGQSVSEAIRCLDIPRLAQRVMYEQESVSEELTIFQEDKKLYLHCNGVRLRDEQGIESGVILVFRDMTDMRRLEGVRREFVANVSHELMTPLTSIRGYTETVLDECDDDPALRRQFLTIVLRQAERLQAIVRDLLSLARLEKEINASEIHLELGEVGPVITNAVQVCGPKAREKKIVITVRYPAAISVRMDAPLLEQALVNLLTNAIKYSDPGAEVEIGAGKNDKGDIVLWVRDEGIGIDAVHLPRLFERFYRSDKNRSRRLGGTGLGLAIVKYIAQAHHGSVGVESEPGKGSLFRITLPSVEKNPGPS